MVSSPPPKAKEEAGGQEARGANERKSSREVGMEQPRCE